MRVVNMTNEFWNWNKTVNSGSIDLYVKEDGIEYRTGPKCDWVRAPKSRLKEASKWHCPGDLAKRVGELSIARAVPDVPMKSSAASSWKNENDYVIDCLFNKND